MINLIFIAILYLVIFLAAELLYYKKVDSFYTRKIVHIGGGLITVLLPWLISFATAIIIGIIFAIILIITKRKKLLGSIHNNDQNSIGAVLYPISLVLCALLFWRTNVLIFQGAVLILALGDGFAALVGKKLNFVPFVINGRKTLSGTIVFLIIAIMILWIIVQPTHFDILAQVLISAIVITSSEACFSGGWDNLSIVLTSGFLLKWLL